MLIPMTKNPDFSHDTSKNRRRYTGVHYHNCHELYYLADGTTKYFIGDRIFQINSGTFVFIPKGMYHKTDSEACMDNERILLSFNDDVLDEKSKEIINALGELFVIYPPKNKLDIFENIFKRIEEEYAAVDELSPHLTGIYICELLTLLFRYRLASPPKSSSADTAIYSVSKYISENYSQNLGLCELSRRFAISESHLSRRFKAVSGIGINEYITFVRIMNAERLLKTQKISITELAQKCGFNDSNYFSTVFKKIKGITPLKYAQKFKKTF